MSIHATVSVAAAVPDVVDVAAVLRSASCVVVAAAVCTQQLYNLHRAVWEYCSF